MSYVADNRSYGRAPLKMQVAWKLAGLALQKLTQFSFFDKIHHRFFHSDLIKGLRNKA